MVRIKKAGFSISAIYLLLILLAGCNLTGTVPGKPQITIQSPASGETIPIGETIVISAIATDPDGSGVKQVELFVDGESYRILEAPSGTTDVFDVALTFIPEVEGTYTLTLIAYRKDGTLSPPATLILYAAGLSLDPDQTRIPTITALPNQPATTLSPTSAIPTAAVHGRVITLANIRSGPGPFCDIIGYAEEGDVINLFELSWDGLWYKTDFVGYEGWIYKDTFTIIDQGTIPRGKQTGCPGCGDRACNLDETCDSCPGDCGECCGNAICEAEYGEDCGACEVDCGPCCGNLVCEPKRGEDCATCSADCGKCCGNGVCEPDQKETCATCAVDCGSCCGNGLCEPGQKETCQTCLADCGKCCGNGLCEAAYGENCTTCQSDCGVCTPVSPVCGDGTCDAAEDCSTCAVDCGVCPAPVCGDGACDAGETCTSCAADCGVCPL